MWMITLEMAWGLRILQTTVIDPLQIEKQIDFVDTQTKEPQIAGMYFFSSASAEA